MNMIQKRQQMRGQSGFTLIELLVAVAILGVLAGVAVFSIGTLTGQSEAAACKTEGETLSTAGSAATATPTSPPDTADDAEDYLKGGASSLKYFTITGTRTPASLTDVPLAKCGNVTV
jgi:prepilin-type N-terminal cleavage/methylation domain-containing protein